MVYRGASSRERIRRRRKVVWRALLWLIFAAVAVMIGYSSYRTGSVLARLEVTEQQASIGRLTEQLASLQTADAGLRRELALTQDAKDALQRRYAADIPNGRLAELYALMADRLRAGVTEDRVAAALHDAEAIRPCDGPMTRKRFLIQTAGQTPDRAVLLLDGLIQVSATAPSGSEGLAKATTVRIAPVRRLSPPLPSSTPRQTPR
jgi:cell division protein FtsB